jgi:hypothetical protein
MARAHGDKDAALLGLTPDPRLPLFIRFREQHVVVLGEPPTPLRFDERQFLIPRRANKPERTNRQGLP